MLGSKSKTIKRRKNIDEIKNENANQHYIWDINKILDNIFRYTEFKDLVEFNTVCKRWNYLTNPIIHRSIKLFRSNAIQNKVYDKRLSNVTRADTEVNECITNNIKFAPYIKEFTFSQSIESQRFIEFFEVFKYIECLTVNELDITENQFINIIKPLVNLKELKLCYVGIKGIDKETCNIQPIQFPSTLDRLSLNRVYTTNNPEIFLKTINSHTDLTEFQIKINKEYRFLEPFCKSYPSLKRFEYYNQFLQLDIHVSLYSIIESNPQLSALKLELHCLDKKIANHINKYSINLEEFNLTEYSCNLNDNFIAYSPFLQPTKIKKMCLTWNKMGSYSLESMLMNCPDLEELSLIEQGALLNENSKFIINLCKLTKIKKLKIECSNLTESSLESIISNCPQLKDLDIRLPRAWKEWIKVIGTKCKVLEKLALRPNSDVFVDESKNYSHELYNSEYFCNPAYKGSLIHLTLNNFNFYYSNDEYFAKFSNLKLINFLWQAKPNPRKNKQLTKQDKNLWSTFDLRENFFHVRYFNIDVVKL
jgi:hypothetical protein